VASSKIRAFLSDPVRQLNQSAVFIKVWATVGVPDVKAAMHHLRNQAPQPVLLVPLNRAKDLTVVVRASEDPCIEFGRSVPTGNWDADLQEIISVLKANGVAAVSKAL